jgi:hypothetical protein
MCTIKNLPTTKANCDEFKHTIQNWMLCPHFPILSWIPWRTPEKTSISLGKFILLCSLGEKAIVELLCILSVSGYWGFFFKGGNGASTRFSPLFRREMFGVMPKGIIFLPELVLGRNTIPQKTSVVMPQGFISSLKLPQGGK